MARPVPGAVKSWHVRDWPETDQRAWSRNILPGDPYDAIVEPGGHYGAALAAATLQKTRKGYGCWLSFLASRGWLEPEQSPLERVTVARLRAYLRYQLRLGHGSGTITGRFADLVRALKIIAPGKPVGWISKPDGATIYSLLLKTQKPVRVPPCEQLFLWGLRMLQSADLLKYPAARLLAYRDGILITLLACRGRRRRSMALVTVGREIFRHEDCYRVELTADQVKTQKPDRFDVRADLTPYLDRYLNETRPALLGGHHHASLLIGQSGLPLSEKGISERIRVLSLKEFGYSFGPHAFRHAISTMLAEHDPQHPGLAAGALDILPETDNQHYNRAKQASAVTKLALLIERRSAAAASAHRT